MALSDFSKQHFLRLSWYFQHGKGGGTPALDPLDLDLVGEKMVARHEVGFGQVRFAITPLGEHVLYLRKEDERARRRPHHALASRLASWLEAQDRLCWENASIMVESNAIPGGRAMVRPDVLSMVKTYNTARMLPMVHEVKVSRADFWADVNKPEKRAAYFALADHVVYVMPEGVVSASEVPPECGLMYETAPGVFKQVKKGRKNKTRVPLSAGQWMALVLKTAGQQPTFDVEAALKDHPLPVPALVEPAPDLERPQAVPRRKVEPVAPSLTNHVVLFPKD